MDLTNRKYLFVIDIILLGLYWVAYYLLRTKTGVWELNAEIDLLFPMLAIIIYWMSIFFLFGLYRAQQIKSRADEFIQIFKAVSIGSILLYIIVFVDDGNSNQNQLSRILMIYHWLLILIFVSLGRISFITYLRKMYLKGKFLRQALIVGWDKKAKELFDELNTFPALGLKLLGFISLKKSTEQSIYKSSNLLGHIENLPAIIQKKKVSEIIIALESTDHDKLLKILELCEPYKVNFKIIPDMYDVISGQLRTNQLYGFPLIEISHRQMQPWESVLKRIIDIIFSTIMLLITLPLSILISVAIKIDSRGPIFFKQERVGCDGDIFIMQKFRTMIHNAEYETGPIWSTQNDIRITKIGLFLRRTRLDEIPQLLNVLKGEMSLVGPRPERPYFVEKFKKEIPFYSRRLKVLPGITGWAQIKQGYDTNITDVKTKLKFDLYYIENMSLRIDLKILFNTFYTMLMGRGQ
ncbi:MAG: sugar transferase [Bacteroidetes bacterium]|nr:sugar transferase [Bacteroidota bacterium]